MGQDQSTLIDEDTPPQTLSARTLSAAADLVKNGRARNIVVMTGAGISTAAGIPDFRSPDTGLYNNLARLNLPYAEAVFDISYFRQNPNPFYVLAQELYPGNYKPTISHVFVSLLAKKGLLRMLFTQNIDCLEREAGVPPDLIVEAHGSFATQRCIECGRPYPDDKMKEHVLKGEVPHCENKSCDGLVKPDIVFFGEQLPETFHRNRGVPATADLALILGTSLTVQPFALLPELVRDDSPRVLFNLERVGGLGSRADDVLVLGDCDSGVRKFADELGWRDELEAEWRRLVGDEEAERQLRSRAKREEALEEEVSKLAAEVELGLEISEAEDEADEGAITGEDKTTAGREPSPAPAAAAAVAKQEAAAPVREDEVGGDASKTEAREPEPAAAPVPAVGDKPGDEQQQKPVEARVEAEAAAKSVEETKEDTERVPAGDATKGGEEKEAQGAEVTTGTPPKSAL
ncbi:NAD-dependent protein deacetylase hst2-1 [Pleurostoma richardsiae]|uniref:NAD-dependent protein deacetylase hst2-1 n=1 Tax=Pleurostoma richardsiae TaxID=41990 RepID=A0AA38S3T2_9PEZI|nr:NAD-dependent protein deacetylase hst2-1 [Pleurostoma richardsiae]